MQRKCTRGVAVARTPGRRWTVAIAFWLGTLGLTAQESRPDTQAWRNAHAQWREQGDDLIARLGDEETTFTPAQQWQDFVLGNAGLVEFATLLLPNRTDLAIAGDADLYLRCLHGPPTDALLRGLLAPAPKPGTETRRRQIDRLMAMRLVVDEARSALLPLVHGIATGTEATYDANTRRVARELLDTRPSDEEDPPIFDEIAELPADSDLVLASDGYATPRLRRMWRAFRDLARELTADALRRTRDKFQSSLLAYSTISTDVVPIVMPLVVARGGSIRVRQACAGMRLAALDSGSLFEFPGFCGIWRGEFDREALASSAKRLAGKTVTTDTVKSTRTSFAWNDRQDAHEITLQIARDRIEVRNGKASEPMGLTRAIALAKRWDELMPGTGGLRAHATLPGAETLDVGVHFAPASVRVVTVLECRDAESATQRLATIRAFLDVVRPVDPASGGVGTPPSLLLKVALHEFGEPKLTQEGARIRVVVEANGSFDDLVTQWVADIGTLLASVK